MAAVLAGAGPLRRLSRQGFGPRPTPMDRRFGPVGGCDASLAKRLIGAGKLPARLSEFDVRQAFCLGAGERGFDGVGVADLMAAAGFTHGGFYKQFGSKADLMAEVMACGIAQTALLADGADASAFVRHYLSRAHRDSRATGCTMAALGGDAARQPEPVRVAFEDGLERQVALLGGNGPAPSGPADAGLARARILGALSQAVGALVLSYACPDDAPLADEILAVCRDAILGSQAPAGTADAKARKRKAG